MILSLFFVCSSFVRLSVRLVRLHIFFVHSSLFFVRLLTDKFCLHIEFNESIRKHTTDVIRNKKSIKGDYHTSLRHQSNKSKKTQSPPIKENMSSTTTEVKVETTSTAMDIDSSSTTTGAAAKKNVDEYANIKPDEAFELLRTEIANLSKSQRAISKLSTALHKAHRKQRAIVLQQKKQPRDAGVNKPKRLTGFDRPVSVTPQMCKFLNKKDDGTKESCMATRIEVTRAINAYIKEKKLNTGRVINVDSVLEKLIGTEKVWKQKLQERREELRETNPEKAETYDADHVTFFNMTRLLRHNFTGDSSTSTTSTATTTTTA